MCVKETERERERVRVHVCVRVCVKPIADRAFSIPAITISKSDANTHTGTCTPTCSSINSTQACTHTCVLFYSHIISHMPVTKSHTDDSSHKPFFSVLTAVFRYQTEPTETEQTR